MSVELPPSFAAPNDGPRNAQSWPDWSILIVDDEPGMRHFMLKTLAPRCQQVLEAASAEEGQQVIQSQHVDLIVLDIALPGCSGLDWLKDLREQGWRGSVILITAFADLDTAIEALRAGAADFILKPFRVPQILNAIKHCFDNARLQRENFVLRHTLLRQDAGLQGLVGHSAALQALRAQLPRLAQVDSPVLLCGESGTGKELVARALHQLSARRNGPFVPVNCGSLAPDQLEISLFGLARGRSGGRDGLFFYAQGGTLFLDEVAELAPGLQAALLRALEDLHICPVGGSHRVPVNVRIMAATHADLGLAVREGRFRQDLYYRLQVLELHLPPLRQRKQDIPDLLHHFMTQLAPRMGAAPLQPSAEQLAYLQQYDWPGNARELRNLVERSLILGELNISALYDAQARTQRPEAPGLPTDLQTLEKQYILSVLVQVHGDKARAAGLLGISRRTLERRLADWAVGV